MSGWLLASLIISPVALILSIFNLVCRIIIHRRKNEACKHNFEYECDPNAFIRNPKNYRRRDRKHLFNKDGSYKGDSPYLI